MSNSSGSSSGVSTGSGLPKVCRCGSSVVTRMSHSDANPHRRFMRCGYAVANRLEGDKFHLFKWEDETVAYEVDKMGMTIDRLEKDVKELQREGKKVEREIKEKLEREVRKVEREMKEKLEREVKKVECEMKDKLEREVKKVECEMKEKIEHDVSKKMKCTFVGVVLVALVSLGLSKIV